MNKFKIRTGTRILHLTLWTLLSFPLFAQTAIKQQSDSINLLVVTGGTSLRNQIDLVPTSFLFFVHRQKRDSLGSCHSG